MSDLSEAPDLATLQIPKDCWTEPFWAGTARQELVLPRCGECQTFRWPPGPFCPHCHSQNTEWLPAGPARLFSYTVVRQRGRSAEDRGRLIIPGLVEFPQAGGVRIMAAIVETRPEDLAIDASLRLGWVLHNHDKLPVFSLD